MNLLEPIEGDRVAGPQDYFQALADYETPLGKYLGAKLGQGWWNSWGGQITAGASLPDNALFRIGGEPLKAVLGLIPEAPHQPGSAPNQPPASQLPHDIIVNRLNALPEDQRVTVLPQVEQALKQRGFKFYTEEEWRNSEHHRDMPFEPFMTVERAKAKAEIYDANRARDWLIAHRPDGALSGTLGFLANTVGGLADPTTLAGLGVGGKLVMNLGRTGVSSLLKGAGIGAADGGISSLAHDYSLRQSQAKWGEHTTDGEIWENAGWAALIGGGLGGGFQGARMARAKPDELGGRPTPTDKSKFTSTVSENPVGPNTNQLGSGLDTPVLGQAPAGLDRASSAQPSVGSTAKPTARPTGALNNTPVEKLLAQLSLEDRAKLFASAVKDFVDNGYKFRADQVFSSRRGLPKGPPSAQVVIRSKSPAVIDEQGRRSFKPDPKEPHVAETANILERDRPGYIVCIKCDLIDPNTGGRIGDIDILTRDGGIQVKAGQGRDLEDQVSRYGKITGGKMVGYGPRLSEETIRRVTDIGGVVTRNIDELPKLLKE